MMVRDAVASELVSPSNLLKKPPKFPWVLNRSFRTELFAEKYKVRQWLKQRIPVYLLREFQSRHTGIAMQADGKLAGVPRSLSWPREVPPARLLLGFAGEVP